MTSKNLKTTFGEPNKNISPTSPKENSIETQPCTVERILALVQNGTLVESLVTVRGTNGNPDVVVYMNQETFEYWSPKDFHPKIVKKSYINAKMELKKKKNP